MGWLWSSNPASGVQTDDAPANKDASALTADSRSGAGRRPNIGLSEEQRARTFGRSASKSRDEQAEQDLENFLSSISSQETAQSTSQASSQTPAPPSSQPTTSSTSRAQQNITRYNPDGSINVHPSALYPRTMSCRQAFDEAFYCQSLGGKFNDIYRFGHLQSCSEHWNAFWFCMRTRTMPAEEKQERIREHYAKREQRKLREAGGSSEDIWEMRTVGVKSAFQRDPDAEDAGEWPVKE